MLQPNPLGGPKRKWIGKMNVQHVNVKFFVDGELNVDWERFIEVFHVWIAEQSTDELLIDVADYRHVPMGPGVILVGHEVDYSMDNTANQPGLRYNDKIEREGSAEDHFRNALRSAAKACLRLETEAAGLKFDRSRFQFLINDRALAPNNDATRQACEQDLPEILANILGAGEYDLQFDTDPRNLFGGVVSVPSPVDFESLAASSVAG